MKSSLAQPTSSPRLHALPTGGGVGVFSTGSPTNPAGLQAGLKELEKRGFKIHLSLDPSANYGATGSGFSGASKESRAQGFMELVRNPLVNILLAARGGYGTMEVLPLLNYQEIGEAKKPIVGYSDITALLHAVTVKSGIPTIHGGTVSKEFSEAHSSAEARASIESLLKMLQEPGSTFNFSCRELRSQNQASEGEIVAGNLTLITALLGTPYDLDLSGKILVIEDVGEAPFRIHRSLLQLKLAGKFKQLSGVVFGRFSGCVAQHGPKIEQVIENSGQEFFAEGNFPVLSNFAFGHGGENQPLPLRGLARIKNGTLEIADTRIGLI